VRGCRSGAALVFDLASRSRDAGGRGCGNVGLDVIIVEAEAGADWASRSLG